MISILMPLYNGVEYLDESLNSVFKQTYTDWEVIIGINGHPPNSDVEWKAKKVVSNQNHDKVRVIYYTTKGKSATLNAMVKDCKYDLIAILDVDDIWEPNKLEAQSRYWNTYDVVGTKCKYFGDKDDVPYIPTGDISNFNFLLSNPIVNSSVVLRKEYGIWNENNTVGLEDYELWLALRISTDVKFYNIPEVLCHHRITKGSAFNNNNDGHVSSLIRKYISILSAYQ